MFILCKISFMKQQCSFWIITLSTVSCHLHWSIRLTSECSPENRTPGYTHRASGHTLEW